MKEISCHAREVTRALITGSPFLRRWHFSWDLMGKDSAIRQLWREGHSRTADSKTLRLRRCRTSIWKGKICASRARGKVAWDELGDAGESRVTLDRMCLHFPGGEKSQWRILSRGLTWVDWFLEGYSGCSLDMGWEKDQIGSRETGHEVAVIV